jgi:transposase
LSRSLAALEHDNTLIAVIEMSQKSWLVGAIVPGIERHPLKELMPDEDELLRLLHRWRDEATKAGRTITRPARSRPARPRKQPAMTRWLRARGIGACHPCLERGDLARASPGEDRSPAPAQAGSSC